jgi:hypothetical protein
MKKCENCSCAHNGNYGSGRFCSMKCARGFSTKSKRSLINEKVSKALKEKYPKKIKFCKICGAERGKCLRPDICTKRQLFPSLEKYFGFNMLLLGSIDIYEEYQRVKNILLEDYIDNELSLPDMAKKYNHGDVRNFNKIINSLGIEKREMSEAQFLYLKNHDVKLPYSKHHYKYGWHITWEGKKIFYRSSYELEYAKYLDENKIQYDVEKLKIIYWDSQLKRQRIAIPDFYLSKENKIVEIKSSWTYDEINMNDKFKAYKEHGYVCELKFM